MTTQHTPEPCDHPACSQRDDCNGGVWLPEQRTAAMDMLFRTIPSNDNEGHDALDAISGCVNACQGITDPETTIPELIEALSDLIEVMDSDGCVPHVQGEEYSEVKATRAVLARLEGGQQG